MIIELRTDAGAILLLQRITPQQEAEFIQLVTRGINTWDTAPKWIKDLNDNLNGNPITSVWKVSDAIN